jgi:hypothetical protein
VPDRARAEETSLAAPPGREAETLQMAAC